MTQPQTPHSFLLVAPPGSGKTQFCLEKIREVVTQTPFAPVWMIVRDRLQAADYRSKLQKRELNLGVEVSTFGDLYQEVLMRSGGGMPVAEEPELRALIQLIVEQEHAAGRLPHFARIYQFPGFITALSDRFAELKRSLIWPEQLTDLVRVENDHTAPAADAAVLGEIANLYAVYQRRLQELACADQEGVTWLGLDALRDDPEMLRDFRLVIVDGFDSFNPAQQQTLQALAGQVQELWITLPGEVGMRRPAHRRFARSLRDLQGCIPLQVVSLPSSSHQPESFAALEARLFEPPQPALPECGCIRLLEAQSPDEEVREALRWIKACIVRDGLSPTECALVVPDFAAYRTAILATAAEFGLPVRLTHAGRMIETPSMAALLDMLFLPVRNYSLRLLLDTIRAPFFDLSLCELHREDAKVLEIVSRYGQIYEGMQQWHEVLAELAFVDLPDAGMSETTPETPGSNLEDAEPEEEPFVPALPKGEHAARLDRGLQSLVAQVTPVDGEQSLDEWIHWLVGLLETVGFPRNCTRGIERQWLEGFRHLLGILANSDRLAGSRPCNYAAFLADFQSMLAGAPAADDLPAADDNLPAGEENVLVLHTFEARGLRFKAVALVGLAEGVFPSVEKADPFLSEAVRAELGMDQRLGQDQAGIFYQMIARADEKLLLTRPYLAKDGESWEPSPFWSAVQEVLGKQAVRVRPEDNRPLSDAASPEELVFWAARRETLTGSSLAEPFDSRLKERYQRLHHAHRVLADRINGVDSATYHGNLNQLAEVLHNRFGSDAVWSASRLESYATCPFSFLVGSGLGLEMIRPPKAGFESFQLGSLLHEALEQIYRDCPEPENVEVVLERLPDVAGRVFAEAPRKYAFRPTLLWEVQKGELLETLRAAVTGLSSQDADAGWQPEAFECRFGIGDAPFLEILVDGQPVRLRGVIDRIDRDRYGHLRVIDYKTGGSHLTAQDLVEGRRLQLPLYALAVQRALGLGNVVEGFYWKLFAQEPGSLRLSRFQCELGEGPKAAYELAMQHIERLVKCIRSGAFTPQPPDGGCPSYCPASSWCWSYRAKAVF